MPNVTIHSGFHEEIRKQAYDTAHARVERAAREIIERHLRAAKEEFQHQVGRMIGSLSIDIGCAVSDALRAGGHERHELVITVNLPDEEEKPE